MLGKGFAALAVGLLLLAAVAGLGVGALLADADRRDRAGGGSDGSTTSASPTPSAGQITASADRTRAAANERVRISGELAGGDAGVGIVVQRRTDGDWADFPAQATTSAGGTFSLFVALGRPGENVLRVAAPSLDAASQPITITIG